MPRGRKGPPSAGTFRAAGSPRELLVSTTSDPHPHSRTGSAAALLGVLGIVYGDIGTSPLYAFKAALVHFSEGGLERWEILGVLSLVFWALIIVVTLKYVLLIMRADNKGEGGILALMALAQRGVTAPRARWLVALIGIAGACLFFGDGIITPAISVLSAVEGLKVISPVFDAAVIPVSLAAILLLFMMQYRGTETVGAIFGPVMALWFLVIGAFGLWHIVQYPEVLSALLPTHAIGFCLQYKHAAFIAFGSVVLAVTGAEALYADMGHFGRWPIEIMWTAFVLPALALNYFGQGALILGDPAAIENPFYLLAPEALRLPLVILATAATVIASQALISGAYSVARQCVQLGFLPRLVVRHTSGHAEGQIYLPQVNLLLAIGVIALVLAFKNSEALASAYGIAVTGTFICTTLLAIVVFHRQFGWSWPLVALAFLPLLLLDFVFFSANLLKVPEGGWVPIVLGLLLFGVMNTWKQGRELMFSRFRQDSLPLKSFLARLPQSRTIRVPGIAVFMTGQADYVPHALLHNLKHNKVLHERVLFVTVLNEDIPTVAEDRRMEVQELAPQIHRVILRYGFQESPNIPRDLAVLRERGIEFDAMQASYFLGRETLVAAVVPKMSRWRQWLFTIMSRNAVPATEFFRIPSDRVVELGARVAI